MCVCVCGDLPVWVSLWKERKSINYTEERFKRKSVCVLCVIHHMWVMTVMIYRPFFWQCNDLFHSPPFTLHQPTTTTTTTTWTFPFVLEASYGSVLGPKERFFRKLIKRQVDINNKAFEQMEKAIETNEAFVTERGRLSPERQERLQGDTTSIEFNLLCYRKKQNRVIVFEAIATSELRGLKLLAKVLQLEAAYSACKDGAHHGRHRVSSSCSMLMMLFKRRWRT